MTTFPPLVLVGGGRMGSALLAGWREQGLSSLFIVDPSEGARALGGAGVTVVPHVDDLPADLAPEAIILAIKPQMADSVLPLYQRFAKMTLFISIMAGKTVSGISTKLGGAISVVRAMPNTPAAVRQGLTVAFARSDLTLAHKHLATRLLAAVGEVAWVAEEAMLDPVTAISGGGPAYVFLLTELLEQAGLDQGLPADLARLMARQTVIGAASLLAASSETPQALRIGVTSPGGTTAEALKLLRADDALPKIFKAAIQAATERSRELSG